MKKNNIQMIIRNASDQDLHQFLEIATHENWVVGTKDDKLLKIADPLGCFVGELNGKIVGIISAINYSNNMGHISYFIVKSQYRGIGIGQKLFKHAKNYLQMQNISLEADKYLLRYYKKEGFSQSFPIYTYKHHLTIGQIDENIRDLKNIDFQKVLDFQKKVSPFVRPKVIKEYYTKICENSIVYIEEGKVKGYCAIKKCFKNYRVAPIYAENQGIALKLLNNVGRYGNCQPKQVIIGVQSNNKSAVRLFQGLGMQKLYEEVRMYNKGMPQLQYNKVYGIFSTDLG